MSWGNYFETGSGSLWPCIGLLKSAMLQSQASTLLCLLTSPLITSSQSNRLRPEAQPLVPSKDPLKNIGLFIDTSQWVWCWSPALNLWQATITNHELLNYGSCWSVRCIRVRLPAKVGPKKGFFFSSLNGLGSSEIIKKQMSRRYCTIVSKFTNYFTVYPETVHGLLLYDIEIHCVYSPRWILFRSVLIIIIIMKLKWNCCSSKSW